MPSSKKKSKAPKAAKATTSDRADIFYMGDDGHTEARSCVESALDYDCQLANTDADEPQWTNLPAVYNGRSTFKFTNRAWRADTASIPPDVAERAAHLLEMDASKYHVEPRKDVPDALVHLAEPYIFRAFGARLWTWSAMNQHWVEVAECEPAQQASALSQLEAMASYVIDLSQYRDY